MKAIKKETSSQKKKREQMKSKAEKKASVPSSRSRTEPAQVKTVSRKNAQTKAPAKKQIIKREDKQISSKKVQKSSQKKNKISKSVKAQTFPATRTLPSPAKRLATRWSVAELPGANKSSISKEKKTGNKHFVPKRISPRGISKVGVMSGPKASPSRVTPSRSQTKQAEIHQRHQRIAKKTADVNKNKKKSSEAIDTLKGSKTTGLKELGAKEAHISALEKALLAKGDKIETLAHEVQKFQEANQSFRNDIVGLTAKIQSIAVAVSRKQPNNDALIAELQSNIQKLQKAWEDGAKDLKKSQNAPERAPHFDTSKIQNIMKPIAERIDLILKHQEETLQAIRHKKIEKDPSPLKQPKNASPVQKRKQRKIKSPPKNETQELKTNNLLEKRTPKAVDKAVKSSEENTQKQNERVKIEAVEALLHAHTLKSEAVEPAATSLPPKTSHKEPSNIIKSSLQQKDSNKGNLDFSKNKGPTIEADQHREPVQKPSGTLPGEKITDKLKTSTTPPIINSPATKVSVPSLPDQTKTFAAQTHQPKSIPQVEEVRHEQTVGLRDFSINFNAHRHVTGESSQGKHNINALAEQKPGESLKEEPKVSPMSQPLAMAPKPLIDSQSKNVPLLATNDVQQQKAPENMPIKIFFDKSEESTSQPPVLPDMTRPAAAKPEEKRNFFS